MFTLFYLFLAIILFIILSVSVLERYFATRLELAFYEVVLYQYANLWHRTDGIVYTVKISMDFNIWRLIFLPNKSRYKMTISRRLPTSQLYTKIPCSAYCYFTVDKVRNRVSYDRYRFAVSKFYTKIIESNERYMDGYQFVEYFKNKYLAYSPVSA